MPEVAVNLAAAQIDVWLTFDAEQSDEEHLREYAALLAPDEIERARRFRDEPRRRQFVVTRALTRTGLSHYAPEVDPADWRFVSSAHGKPALASSFAGHGFHFNAAHTVGLVALAVARAPDIGVDVENVVEGSTPLRVATRYFDVDEVRELESLPTGEKRRRFYALWTLKEAWLKATGRGLAAGLGTISFSLDPTHRARAVRFMNETDGSWSFWQAQVSREHLLAVGVRAAAAADWNVNLYRCVPGELPTRTALPAPRPLGNSVQPLREEERSQA
jgi:4'-phosphopantetheinyl transferase